MNTLPIELIKIIDQYSRQIKYGEVMTELTNTYKRFAHYYTMTDKLLIMIRFGNCYMEMQMCTICNKIESPLKRREKHNCSCSDEWLRAMDERDEIDEIDEIMNRANTPPQTLILRHYDESRDYIAGGFV